MNYNLILLLISAILTAVSLTAVSIILIGIGFEIALIQA